MRFLLALLTLLPAAAWAQGLQPQAPAPQTTEAEFWYAMASVAMILTLAAAGWMARRR
jgi:hypothetical protein